MTDDVYCDRYNIMKYELRYTDANYLQFTISNAICKGELHQERPNACICMTLIVQSRIPLTKHCSITLNKNTDFTFLLSNAHCNIGNIGLIKNLKTQSEPQFKI